MARSHSLLEELLALWGPPHVSFLEKKAYFDSEEKTALQIVKIRLFKIPFRVKPRCYLGTRT